MADGIDLRNLSEVIQAKILALQLPKYTEARTILLGLAENKVKERNKHELEKKEGINKSTKPNETKLKGNKRTIIKECIRYEIIINMKSKEQILEEYPGLVIRTYNPIEKDIKKEIMNNRFEISKTIKSTKIKDIPIDEVSTKQVLSYLKNYPEHKTEQIHEKTGLEFRIIIKILRDNGIKNIPQSISATELELKEIEKYYKQEISQKALTGIYARGYHVLKHHFDIEIAERNKKKDEFNSMLNKRVKELWNNGIKVAAQIGKILRADHPDGCSDGTIEQRLTDLGLVLPKLNGFDLYNRLLMIKMNKYDKFTQKKISEVFKCSKDTVRNIFNYHNHSVTKHGRILTNNEKKEIYDLYKKRQESTNKEDIDAGKVKNLAKRYKCNESTIRNLLHYTFHVPFQMEKLTKEQQKEIVDNYPIDKSLTISYYSRKFKCDHKTVKRILVKNNIPIRLYKLNDNEKQEILNLFKSSKIHYVDLAKKYNVHRETITNVITNSELALKLSDLNFDQRKAIAVFYQEGNGMPSIFRKFKIFNYNDIVTILNEFNIPLRKTKTELKTFEQDLITKYTEDKLSVNAIATEYNTSYYLVLNTLKENDIARRKFIYNYNRNYFDVIDDPEKPYILGIFVTDATNSGMGVTLALQERDLHILYDIRERFGGNVPISISKYAGRENIIGRMCNIQNQYRLRFSSKYLSEKLTELGIVKNKTYVTKWLDCIGDEESYIRSFIRGSFDGDGWISVSYEKATKRIRLEVGICGASEFLEEIMKRTSFLGMNWLEERNIKNVKMQNYMRTKIRSNEFALKFLHWLYTDSTIHLNRKYELYLEWMDHLKDPKKSALRRRLETERGISREDDIIELKVTN